MIITIKKYDPAVDDAPYYKDYEIEYSEHMSALKAVLTIHETIEPVAFDYSCRGRVCGRCAMKIDGVPGTACTTCLDDGNHVIEPLDGFRVVKDLVVDKTEFHDRIATVELRQRATQITAEEVFGTVDYANFKKINALDWCCRCGSCQSACPVVNAEGTANTYIGPSGMVGIALRHYDPYDTGDRVAEAVQEGLWNCIMCGMCDTVCPALEIDHLATWQDLRDAAAERGLTEEKKPLLPFNM